MFAAMKAAGGIGLAAQQIGQALQLCVVDLRSVDSEFFWELDGARPPLDLFMPLAVVNPVLTIHPGAEVVFEEGCLSFPKIRGDVIRRESLTAKFQDGQGVPHVLRCDGLLARCLQHEVDHLHGILFIDRMEKPEREKVMPAVKALAKESRGARAAARPAA